MTNKLSCSSRSSDEQHDPNHLLAKTTTFEGSFFSCVLSLHCRNKSLSPSNEIGLVLVFLVSVCSHKCWGGFRFITVRLHEVFNLRIKENHIVGNEMIARDKTLRYYLRFFLFTSLELSSYSLNGRVLAAFPDNKLQSQHCKKASMY